MAQRSVAAGNNRAVAANLWLMRKICSPLGISEVPRGRPLVRFRLTEADSKVLAPLLQEHLRPTNDAPARLAALFCLFAVDTLRRHPPGAPGLGRTLQIQCRPPTSRSRT